MSDWDYETLKQIVGGRSLPLVLVDLERFDANVRSFTERLTNKQKTIRLASKSIRVPALIRRAFEMGGSAMRGLMCYNAREACFLATYGFDDLLVAYPTVDPTDIATVAQSAQNGKQLCLTIDCADHIAKLTAIWKSLGVSVPLRVCIDVDVSWRPGDFHIGVMRSPVRTAADFEQLVDMVLASPVLQLVGVLAYDAHLAGVGDLTPNATTRNLQVRIMKWFATSDVTAKRDQYHRILERKGVQVEFFNGGGTGSFEVAIHDPQLTEVTLGSGLLQPQLFDYYRGTHRLPAFCFALAVTRQPQFDRVTCQGGGFIASGAIGKDRVPIPILPTGLRVEAREGFGEVQTPLAVPSRLHGTLSIGDPIFFRPAKAGEIADHFAEYHLMEGGNITELVPTYRGLGQCFH